MDDLAHVAIIDYGSQTTMLIARKVRELGVMAQIIPHQEAEKVLLKQTPLAIILSGSFSSVYAENAPILSPQILASKVPTLGICYGMQLLAFGLGGSIIPGDKKEFGQRTIDIDESSLLFDTIGQTASVWMSHGDQIFIDHPDVKTIAKSATCPHVAIELTAQKIYGLQFHPEVFHTERGMDILANFLFKIALITPNFKLNSFIDETINTLKATVQHDHVIMALSGGVDSSVAAVLIHKAIGNNLHCVYVDHGLGRLNEVDEIKHLFLEELRMDCTFIDAKEQFYAGLSHVSDPEQKRKIIGRLFIEIFEQEAQKHPNVKFLGQGTLYPDVIESFSQGHVIKSHHNVGGLPKRMNLSLLEPLRYFFKDEVRALGLLLGLPKSLIYRQPFPGPGLAVRIAGEISKQAITIVQKADAIVREEIEKAIKEDIITKPLWQWFAVLLPTKSVGVKGDARVYGNAVVIRIVESQDAMTADWSDIPHKLLRLISSRITNEVEQISRVLYDVTQKPPGTIEWE